MELPYSTPSAAIKYEFGLIDLSLEILMEKVLFAVKVLRSDDDRKAKQLLQIMLSKKVPGFCTHVLDICANVFEMGIGELVEMEEDVRKVLKEKLIGLQDMRIRKQMITQSKTDQLLMRSYSFNGQRKKYLDLPFRLARIVFMVRCRMLLTKDNFPGRWQGTVCNVCSSPDTDEHLFRCPGFTDILDDSVSYNLFLSDEQDLETLAGAAEKMLLVNERLKVIQEMDC